MNYMVAIQALVTAITFTLVILAARLTFELDAYEALDQE
jgi:formiminotetrahydrofolate cyclodeaminase